jgi:hypothetical protein
VDDDRDEGDLVNLYPNEREIRALRLFVSEDTTREHLCRLWMYGSEGGLTYVATDGHTLVARRSGTHRDMSPTDVARFEPYEANEQGLVLATPVKPPAWGSLCRPPAQGKLATSYGFSTEYFARVGEVERAAGLRAAADLTRCAGMSVKNWVKKKAELKTSIFARWVFPSDPLDGIFWSVAADAADAALWSGVVMPRQV